MIYCMLKICVTCSSFSVEVILSPVHQTVHFDQSGCRICLNLLLELVAPLVATIASSSIIGLGFLMKTTEHVILPFLCDLFKLAQLLNTYWLILCNFAHESFNNAFMVFYAFEVFFLLIDSKLPAGCYMRKRSSRVIIS